MMKQEQFAGMRARLMEQLQQGVEWSDEAILERLCDDTGQTQQS